MAGFNIDDYVDVAERIAVFKAQYPEGSLQSDLRYQEQPAGWFAQAKAYRTPDDPTPGVGHAFEPVPGKTPYTKDSECMNAETAAWGRAIVALGFPTKKIASAQEVRARQSSPAPSSAGGVPTTAAAAPPAAAVPTSEELILLYELVESKGGDAAATKAAYETAIGRGNVVAASWYQKAKKHWEDASPFAAKAEKAQKNRGASEKSEVAA